MFSENTKDINGLIKEFHEILGLDDYKLSETQLVEVFKEIEKYPYNSRTIRQWQSVITLKTGFRNFSYRKALDLSDVNHIHQQIQALLKGK